MSARSELLLPGEWNDPLLALVAAPLRERDIRPLEVGKIDMRRDCPPDDKFWSVVINNVKYSITPLNIERPGYIYFCVQVPPHDSTPSHWLTPKPEQVEECSQLLDSRNGLISINAPFLSTAPHVRRVVVVFPTQLTGADRRISAPRPGAQPLSSSATPLPANDNEDWREAA